MTKIGLSFGSGIVQQDHGDKRNVFASPCQVLKAVTLEEASELLPGHFRDLREVVSVPLIINRKLAG